MSLSIKEIQAPIAAEMDAFEGKFRQFMKTKVMLLDTIMNYIVQRKGNNSDLCLYSCRRECLAKSLKKPIVVQHLSSFFTQLRLCTTMW
jgi:hypothetical protein